ncbi:MAG: serine/threonine protein kinase [Marinovum sp.]|nr:serine/threonine protein kinase [Marinovum sp.]
MSQTTPPSGYDDDEEDDRTVIAPLSPKSPTQTAIQDEVEEDTDATIIAPMGGDATSTGSQNAPVEANGLEPGMLINNMYRVEHALDQGGMGRVFRGVETETDEPVAIKVILPEIADDQKFGGMFRDEAKTLRQLHHDAIVRYFSYFSPSEQLNMHVLVMDFINGMALSDHLKKKGALSVPQCCDLFARLADGLQVAHDKGVIHRDLSPDNVMLPGDNISKAVLIDFGIAQSTQIKDSALGNDFAGKLKYASPEQLEGGAANTDGRSDIYSLGLLLIAASTGAPLNMGRNFLEAQEKRKTVPELGPVPFEFRVVLETMLQPEPENRFATMSDVKRAFENIAAGRDAFAITTDVTRRGDMTMRPTEGLQAAPVLYSGTNPGVGTTGTASGISQVGAGTHNEFDDASPSSGGGLKYILIGLVLAGVIGGGAYVAMPELLTGSNSSDTALEAKAEEDTGPVRLEGSREAFLAETLPDGCAFATLRRFGPNAGQIEAFAQPGMDMDGIPDAWATNFGTPPTVLNRTISAQQCAALTLTRRFQGTAGAGMELTLRSNMVSREEGIVGTVHGSAGRADWLALITPEGRVFALTRQFEDPIGDERQFSFRMRGAQLGSYLVMSITSEKALVRAAAMQDGTLAVDLFELIGRELGNDLRGAVDIAFLELGT